MRVEAVRADPTLCELQTRMTQALFAQNPAGQGLPAAWFGGPLSGAEGLKVHRNTVLGALSTALRQSYPAIDRLVGEAFFDRMAIAFTRAHPPAEPQLAAWGAGFAEFVAGFPGTEQLAFLPELARFEWLLDELSRSLPGDVETASAWPLGEGQGQGEGLWLRFAPTLRLLPTQFPIAALHEALLVEDAERVAQLAAQVGEGAQALWRDAEGVHARTLQPAAARCLALLLAGETLPAALEAARGELDAADFMNLISTDLLQAGFSQLSGAQP
jgi:hypothetical protein